MTAEIRTSLFWLGLLVYFTSFFLSAVVNSGEVARGFQCAWLSVIVVPMIGEIFRFYNFSVHSVLESAAILFNLLINPLLLLYAIASPIRPADRTVRMSRVFIPIAIPFCWVIFHYEDYQPLVGHFLWILGMLLVLVSGYSINRLSPNQESVRS